MSKVKLAIVTAVGIGILLATANPAAAGGEKTYWMGKGTTKHSRVEFIVNDGKVRDLLTGTGTLRCSDGEKRDVFKSFDPIHLDHNAFESRESYPNSSTFFAAGHIRGQVASGRLESRSRSRSVVCQSETVQWEAEQVTREEWHAAHQHH